MLFNRRRLSILALIMTFLMTAGFITPVMAAEGYHQNNIFLMSDEAVVDTYISSGDNYWVTELPPIDSAAAIEATFDMFADLGIRRVYWRGMQQAIWNKIMYVREENVKYAYGVWKSVEKIYGAIDPDKLAVEAAHARGMEIWGVSTLQDWGSSGDTPCMNDYPHNSEATFRINNPEWVPVDQYGILKQGGPVDFSYPEARKTLIDLHVNEIKEVGYDGVVFLNYAENFSLRFQDEYGYNQPIAEEFFNRYGSKPGTQYFSRFASREDWRELRGEYVTQFLRELKDELSQIEREGEEAKLGMFINPQRPYFPQPWNVPNTLLNGIHMDLEAWASENIVDQFIVYGNCSVNMQSNTIKDLLWLTRGTNTDVSFTSSNPYYAGWKGFQENGVATISNIGGLGEEAYFLRSNIPAQNISVLNGNDRKLIMRLLSQIIDGKTGASVSDIQHLLEDPNPIIRRMTLKALGAIKAPEAIPLIEAALNDAENCVRGIAALVLRNLSGADSARKLLEAVDTYDDPLLYDVVVPTLGSMKPFPKDLLVDVYSTSENPIVRMVAMRALGFGPSQDLVPLFAQGIQDSDRYVRFAAVEALGKIGRSTAAADILIEATKNEDVVVSDRAATSLAVVAAREEAEIASRRPLILQALRDLFAKLGDGCQRADAEWGYRPVGNALLAMGGAGEEALRGYMNQTLDKKLAESAWKCLYIRQKPGEYGEVSEKENEAAFGMYPQFLKSFNRKILSQSFDNTSLYHTGLNGMTGDYYNGQGRWGAFSPGGTAVDGTVFHSSPQSAKVVRGYGLAGYHYPGTKNGEDYKASFWAYREPGSSFSMFTASATGKYETGLLVNADGSIALYNYKDDKFNIASGISMPEGKWTNIIITAGRSGKTFSISVIPEGEGEQTSGIEAEMQVLTEVNRILFYSQIAGKHIYIDDVEWFEASAYQTSTTVTMSDSIVTYDGVPHSLTAVTYPADLELKIEYMGIEDTHYSKTETAPVNAGKYRVTAAVTATGYSGHASAVLTIRKAVPAAGAGVGVNAINYGQTLGDAALSGTFLDILGEPLDGTFSWDEGNGLIPVQTGPHPYTFTPVDANYDVVQENIEVVVNMEGYGAVERVSQDFEDTLLFNDTLNNANVGDYSTRVGRWGPFSPNGPVIDSTIAHSSAQSVKLIRGGSGLYVNINPGIEDGGNYGLTYWVYRDPGSSFVMVSQNAQGAYEAGLLVNTAGTVIYYNASEGKYNIDSGLVIPEEKWTELYMLVSREEDFFSLTITPEGEQKQSSAVHAGLQEKNGVVKILFNPQPPEGKHVYMDDFRWFEITGTAAIATVTMPDKTVVYDGNGHSLSAATEPEGLELEIQYQGVEGTIYAKTDVAPANAGKYAVTAIVKTPGYAGAATAALIIGQAAPSAGMDVSAGPIDYGQTLGDAALSGTFLDILGEPLDGTFSWDEGNDVIPAETGLHLYTFTPADTNYNVVKGSVTVTVNPAGTYTITAVVAGGNGVITPSGAVTVNEGGNQSFTITPASGYVIDSLMVDGLPVTPEGNAYTFTDVRANHTVNVSFKKDPVRVSQDFEDTLLFNDTLNNVNVGDYSTRIGRWGPFSPNGPVIDSTIAHGSAQSVKLIRGGSGLYVNINPGIEDGGNYGVTYWVYRDPGSSFVMVSQNAQGVYEAGLLVNTAGNVIYYNASEGKYNIDSGLVIPEEKWTELDMAVSREEDFFSLTITPEGEQKQSSAVHAGLQEQNGVVKILFNPQPPEGKYVYMDDFRWFEITGTAAIATMTMPDKTVVYDGNRHSLSAATEPEGLELEIQYQGVEETIYAKTDVAPANAGKYAVTAIVKAPGYAGAAAAVLTIGQAAPSAGMDVSADPIDYGQTLADTALNGTFLDILGEPLDGSFSWDEGNDVIPAETGLHPYTFTPADTNYNVVKGSVTVTVNPAGTFTITAVVTGGNGVITPNGTVTVNEGGYQSFTITPASGYVIDSLMVDGLPAAPEGNAYTFTDVKSNRTISVSFKQEAGGNSDSSAAGEGPAPETKPEAKPEITERNGDVIIAEEAISTVDSTDKRSYSVGIDSNIISGAAGHQSSGGTIEIKIPSVLKDEQKATEINLRLTAKDMDICSELGISLKVSTGDLSYIISPDSIDPDWVLSQFEGASLGDIELTVTITTPPKEEIQKAADELRKSGKQLLGYLQSFGITAAYGDKTVNIDTFNSYVARDIEIDQKTIDRIISENRMQESAAELTIEEIAKLLEEGTTAVVIQSGGSISHVPTSIRYENGKFYARFSSLTNSTYAIIYSVVNFKDISGHWAASSIQNMANRTVISGTGNGKFEPERNVTRGEFANIIVTSLGLFRRGEGYDVFSDVKPGKFYYDTVSKGVDYKLISGIGNNMFAPEAKVTWQEALAILVRASRLTGAYAVVTDGEVDNILARFSDSGSIAAWARKDAALAVKLGYTAGNNGKLNPEENLSRAESVVMIEKMLKSAALINT